MDLPEKVFSHNSLFPGWLHNTHLLDHAWVSKYERTDWGNGVTTYDNWSLLQLL